MASHQQLNFQGQIPGEFLIARIMQIHASISKLESLRPSKQVNILFSHLVKLCILPSSIDIKALPQEVQQMRQSLIILCARAESLLELEFATYLSKISLPLNDRSLSYIIWPHCLANTHKKLHVALWHNLSKFICQIIKFTDSIIFHLDKQSNTDTEREKRID